MVLIFLAACAPLIVVSPSPQPPTLTPLPPSPTPILAAASVNGEIIPLAEFNAELERYQRAQSGLGKTVSAQDAASAVLDELIAETLLAQAAQEAGFSLDDSALQARRADLAAKMGGEQALLDWQKAQGYDEESFRRALRRSLAAAWMRDKIAAAVPASAEQVHVRQILTYNAADAQEVSDQLAAGTAFDDLAAIYDPQTHGDIGWFPRGYLQAAAIEEAAFSLEVDAVSPVIETELGFHVIKVLERQTARPLAPDVLLALRARAVAQWLAERRQNSQISLAPQ
ncbi:MAG: peptidylprolyl isomerase [Anaerolineales bacterium]